MKTLKPLFILLTILCCSYYSNAQLLCGATAEFYQTVNPNNVYTFHDTSTVSANWQIYSYHWNFGDGDTSNLQSPSHVYAASGTYTVCETITAYGLGVSCSDDVCHQIT